MEYLAVINGLVLAEPGDEVRTDSQLVVRQLEGRYKVKAITLMPFYEAAKRLCELKNIKVKWIPREQNQADRLFRQGENR
jgi:ribonuclease H / adenosylcobalamin/alpha-ribazole phosphatase